jgi:hypothetical protein
MVRVMVFSATSNNISDIEAWLMALTSFMGRYANTSN